MIEMLKRAKAAKAEVSCLTAHQKNAALRAMAAALVRNEAAILQANAQDLMAAQDTIPQVMLDRLLLNSSRIKAMADGIKEVAALPDPVGHILEEYVRQDGLKIQKISVPMGVIAIIYESRPNVTSDAAALALKSGNVCVLRGGKEAYRSAKAIVDALRQGLKAAGITEDAINLVEDTSRDSATALMTANGYIDLLIPRGGAGLINACVRQATVPCIATGTGICHIYVEKTADLDMALDIIPGTPAGEKDFDTEFLDYILAVKCVKDVQEAIEHISEHSTGHSEAIISLDAVSIARFSAGVDSAAVYLNASTRFTDGGEFGLGCEMGISTQKLHARGPMGLKELTTYKYLIHGNGHIR